VKALYRTIKKGVLCNSRKNTTALDGPQDYQIRRCVLVSFRQSLQHAPRTPLLAKDTARVNLQNVTVRDKGTKFKPTSSHGIIGVTDG
jgi:hypothetical protein